MVRLGRKNSQVLRVAMSVAAARRALVPLGLTGGLRSSRSAFYTTCRRACDLVAIGWKADIAQTDQFGRD
jgi:hypothetical protein